MKKEKLFSKKDLMFKLLLAICFGMIILLPTIGIASTTLDGNASLGGFEGFTSYITKGVSYFRWVVGIIGVLLLSFGVVELAADNTQFTRFIQRLVIAAVCIGVALKATSVVKALGGATIDMQISNRKIRKSKFRI